jgi:hypothetical protein
MAGETKAVRTIASLERLWLSRVGNPRFQVVFTDGTAAQTATDASVNYGIENPEYRDVPLEVTFNRAGKIVHLEVIEVAETKVVRRRGQ